MGDELDLAIFNCVQARIAEREQRIHGAHDVGGANLREARYFAENNPVFFTHFVRAAERPDYDADLWSAKVEVELLCPDPGEVGEGWHPGPFRRAWLGFLRFLLRILP